VPDVDKWKRHHLQRAAFMRLSRRVTRPAVYGWGKVPVNSERGLSASFFSPALASLAAEVKAWPMKHAEARSSLIVTVASGRKTAGLVTLRESPMNRA